MELGLWACFQSKETTIRPEFPSDENMTASGCWQAFGMNNERNRRCPSPRPGVSTRAWLLTTVGEPDGQAERRWLETGGFALAALNRNRLEPEGFVGRSTPANSTAPDGTSNEDFLNTADETNTGRKRTGRRATKGR